MELSGANPLTEFAAWFFGSVAVLFVGLLIYNLWEMKSAIRSLINNQEQLSDAQGDHDTEIKLLKQVQINSNDKQTKMEEVLGRLNESVTRLNLTLALMNRDSDMPRNFNNRKND